MKQLKLKTKQLGFLGLAEVISGAFGLAGGALANKGASDRSDDAAAFNQATAREQMEFQERMSSTAHQREIKDLEAAGLNPLLSAKYGGASTPTGAAGSKTAAPVKDIISPAISTALNVAQAKATVNNTTAQTRNLEIDSRQKEQDIRLGERNIEGKALTNQEIKTRLLYIQPEEITQAKQKTINQKLEHAIKGVQFESQKEELLHLKTRLTEAKSKEAYWKILGANAHLLTTAVKGVALGATILGVLKSISPAGILKKGGDKLLKNNRKGDFGKSHRRKSDNTSTKKSRRKNFAKKNFDIMTGEIK